MQDFRHFKNPLCKCFVEGHALKMFLKPQGYVKRHIMAFGGNTECKHNFV